MVKKVRGIMNTIKKNNRGFSIIELLTAIAILAVLAVTVVFVMNSSSKTYSSLSVEAQLQSEAQLVANMITELAIDSFDAESATTESFGYPGDSGKILLLESTADSVKTQYIIGRKEADNALYLRERTFNTSAPGGGSWDMVSEEALLGNYITGFTVDTSRVDSENILMFTLEYEKNGRTYVGNYQVLMRNRAYADKEENPLTPQAGAVLSIDLSPKLVYIDIVGGSVPCYYKNTISDSEKVTLAQNGIEFTSTVRTNQMNAGEDVDWALKNADTAIFSMDPANGAVGHLKWDIQNKAFIDSPTDAFTVVITKSVNLSDGSDTIEASPKTAQVLLRRIKNLSLYALSGVTQWKPEYESVYEGVPASEAQGYAYAGSDGKYQKVSVSASISSSNIAYGGGVTWKLYMKDSTGNWSECTNSSFASLADSVTETSTTNTVTLGSNASNGQVYKVVATSIFDPSFEDEYIFGIAPDAIPDKDGYNSRGFYTSMSSYWKGKKPQDNMAAIDEVLWMTCTSISGGEKPQVAEYEYNSDNQIVRIKKDIDKVKILQDAEGTWRFYIDYDAFTYMGEQKSNFYTSDSEIKFTILYRDTDGKYRIAGDYKSDFKTYSAAIVGIDPKDIIDADGSFVYKLGITSVSKVSPARDIVVIEKGKDQLIDVKTEFYNILEPTRGAHYLGVFLDDMDTNLMGDGMGSTNAFFSVERTSQYGNVYRYVDEVVLNVTAKSNQKKYPTDPLTLRVTANDYYMIKPGTYPLSYTDYRLLVANVEGTNCYIPGPSSKANGLAWPAAANTAKTEVTGYNSNGDTVKATVYKEGNSYYCQYGGRKYTYSNVYGVWRK